MIGKTLRERYELGALPADRAIAILKEALDAHAKPLVEVRAKGPRMVACLIVRADDATLRTCRQLGLRIKPGGTAVFGLLGHDVVRLFPTLSETQLRWLEQPCGARETKVLLLAGGTAVLSLETHDGPLSIRAVD